MVDTQPIDTAKINALKVNGTSVFLENTGLNSGSIIISNNYSKNYSYSWGAMGGTIEEFIQSISSDYFANKLLCKESAWTFNCAGTFKNVRKYIREEICLPWYKHVDFQKEMRYELKKFEESCEDGGEHYFVNSFCSFIEKVDFSLIEERHERETIKKEFRSMSSEPWCFSDKKLSEDYNWICKFHKDLKKSLTDSKNKIESK